MQLHVFKPPPPEPPEIYLSDSGFPEEFWRSVDIALLATEPRGPILFDGGADRWPGWLDAEFSETVAPHLVDARTVCSGGVGILELVELDVKFDQQLLAPEARERSIAASRILLDRTEGARRIEPIAKLKRQIELSGCPGHAASVFALQSALFNLSAAATIIGYLCLEWRGAFPSGADGSWRENFERLTPALAEKMPGWLQSGAQNTFQPHLVD